MAISGGKNSSKLRTSGNAIVYINGSATGVGAHNWSWVEQQSFFGGGNGSWNNPYILENYNVHGSYSNSCLQIVDTEKHFILRNFELKWSNYYNSPDPYNTGAGLILVNVNNSQINNCDIFENTGYGIYLHSCNNIKLSNNYIGRNKYGIFAEYSSNLTFIDNDIYGNLYDGLYIEHIYDCNISGNIIHWNNQMGLYHESHENEVSKNNNIIGNYIENNAWLGVVIRYFDNGTIGYNDIMDNGFDGLSMGWCDDNTIIGNQIIGNKNDSIQESSCTGNIFINNTCGLPKNMSIEVVEQTFTTQQFNLTFFISGENGNGIIVDSIDMGWNGVNATSNVTLLGEGYYLASLSPITVTPDEDPILLNMTVTADGYEDKYFETRLAVDPKTIEKEQSQDPEETEDPDDSGADDTTPTPFPAIPGYNLLILIALASLASIRLIVKKKH